MEMKTFTLNCTIDAKNYEIYYRLNPNDSIGNFIRSGMPYEPDVSLFLMRILREGDFFVDVGAHVGYFSILAARLIGDTGQVISFEPEDSNFRDFQANVTLNNLSNIIQIQKAVNNKSEERTFYVNSDNGGGHALWDPALFPGNEKSKTTPKPRNVQTITLDSVLSDMGGKRCPKIVKIDTEGAEKSVLEGARDMLQKEKTPFIICELHEFGLREMGSSQYELRSLMQEYNYDTFLLPYDGGLPKLVPHGVQIQSKIFLNILFTRSEWLSPYWPVIFVDPDKLV